ncbi:MAG TPA: hypothetical protein VMF13_01960 [Luteitalea sp.]|nr:hypothetical protein [Luteitalea sp.]
MAGPGTLHAHAIGEREDGNAIAVGEARDQLTHGVAQAVEGGTRDAATEVEADHHVGAVGRAHRLDPLFDAVVADEEVLCREVRDGAPCIVGPRIDRHDVDAGPEQRRGLLRVTDGHGQASQEGSAGDE